jgi:hypothetical protein
VAIHHINSPIGQQGPSPTRGPCNFPAFKQKKELSMNIIAAILIAMLVYLIVNLIINGVRMYRYISSGEYSLDKRLRTMLGNNDDQLSSN